MHRALGILSVALLVPVLCLAQRSELGFGLGTFTYTGDLAPTYRLSNSRPAATVLFRSNLSKVISFRASITAGKLGASETPTDAFASQRDHSFDVFLFEGSTVMEYHFLDWRDSKKPMRYTPYLFAGLSLFGISGTNDKASDYSTIQPAIPFGGGFKYIMNPKWYAAFEIGIRKTFFDYLDNISDGELNNKNYQYGNPNDFDNFFFVGITFTRTFYDIPCPTNPYK